MLKVTWRGVVEHPVRFLMSVIAVVLGIAFVTGTFALRGVLATTFHDIVDSSMAADVYVRGEPLGDADAGELDAATGQSSNRAQVAASLAETIDEVSGVRVALPAYTGSVVLVGADGTAVTTSGAPSFGVDASADDPTLSLLEGRWPQSSSEIALEHSALVHSGLSVGDTTTIVAAGQIMDVTVVGDLGFDAAVSGAIIVGLDSDTAAALFAPDGTVDSIAVFGDGSQDEEALAGRVSSALSGSEVSVVTGDEARAESRAAVDQIVGFIGTFLMIFAVIALFVGGFIITNTFTMAVRQRLREIAVLRAVGASPRQVFASVVGQAAIVGLVGSALGILGGAGLIEIVKKLFASMGMELASSIPITRSTVAVALVTGLLVSVLAAAIPARRAAKVPPVDAMNESIGGKEKPLRTRTVIGAALLVAGAACLIGATRADGGVANWSLGVGAAGLLIGALVVAPAVMPVASRVLSWPFVVIGRPVVALARGNLERNPRRSASTASALMIGMALVGAAATVAASTESSVAGIVDETVHADLILRGAQGDIPAGAADAASQVPGIARFDRLDYGPAVVDGEYTYVSAAEPGFFPDTMSVTTVAGDLSSFDRGDALASTTAADTYGWTVGQSLTVTAVAPSADGTTGAREVRLGAIFESQGLGVGLMVPEDVLDATMPAQVRLLNTVFVTVADDADPAQVRAGLTEAVAPYLVVSVQDQEEFTASLTSQVQQMLSILYALLALSIVIAVLGIVNSLALSIMERTREIGLERAVGLGRLQLAGVTVVESVMTALFGTTFGLAIGVGVASALPTVYADQGLSELVIPWGELGGMLGLAVVVGVLAALWPAVRAARLPVLTSIASE